MEERLHLGVPPHIGEAVADPHQAHQAEPAAAITPVEFRPVFPDKVPRRAPPSNVARNRPNHRDGVLGPHLVSKRPSQRFFKQILLVEPCQADQHPDFLFLEVRSPGQFPQLVVGGRVPSLGCQAVHDPSQVGMYRCWLSLVSVKLSRRFLEDRCVSVVPGLAQHGAAQQRVQVSLAGTGFPPDSRRCGTEQVPGELLEGGVVRFVGHQVFNLPQVACQVAPHRRVRLIPIRLGQREELGYRQQSGP